MVGVANKGWFRPALLVGLIAAGLVAACGDDGTSTGGASSGGEAGTPGQAGSKTGGSSSDGGKAGMPNGGKSGGGMPGGGDASSGGNAQAGEAGMSSGSGGMAGDQGAAGSDGSAGEVGAGGEGGGTATAAEGGAAGEMASGGAGGAPAPVCGDGLAEANECEPSSSGLCSDDCVAVATPACYECEQNGDCWEFSESCLAFEGVERARCYDVQECVVVSGCGDGANTLTSCFCGELTTGDCIAAPSSGPGSPDGACAAVIRDAMGAPTATNAQVLTRYINVAYPGGAALARMNCDKLAPACSGVCGF